MQAPERMVALSLWASYGHVLSPVSRGSQWLLYIDSPHYGTKLLHVVLFFFISYICMCMTQHMCEGDQKTTLGSLFSPSTVWELRY